ncbi:MAG: antibiotic biosynthesis monooxygenase [Geobacteraceae bacterium]|nr:antibiotic biosynthesis monooxygenase [Geobacteraceae bacterium]
MKGDHEPYTSGSFIVKQGQESDFIVAVEAVAEWTIENYSSVSEITLFRDLTKNSRFVTLFCWDDEESIDAWRADPEFGVYMTQIREHCEKVEVSNLERARRFTRM